MSSKSLRRRAAAFSPPTKFTIFSEGKNTEPEYFYAIARSIKGALVKVEVVRAAGTPKTIASKALAFRKDGRRRNLSSFEEKDQTWVVFDRDEHDAVKESIDNLTKNGIGIAFTNPCFELWLILHIEDFDKPIDRHAVQKHLESICSEYSIRHGKKPDCMQFMINVEVAEDRATKMNERRLNEGAEQQAPWTTVHQLTRAIRAAAAK
ncbi:RloB family protein [Rhizobium brockwellii]|uniref:RloB family protein n=1 Tax=Rhizobium brockwellii TaxID=3019932 RepID=UPI003F9A6CDB